MQSRLVLSRKQFKVRSAQTDCGDFEPQSPFVKVNISELISELLTDVFLSVPSSCLLSLLHRLNVQRAEGLYFCNVSLLKSSEGLK